MAAQKLLLNINYLDEVLKVLKKYNYSGTSYYRFGLSLGLSAPTLDVIEKDHKGDTVRCLLECLKKWLSRVDIVESKGDPSWYTLIAALRAIGENAVADGIDKEKHPACVIFTRYQSDQSLQDSLPSLTILLHKEGITKEILPAAGGTADLLVTVQDAVCLNHENLEKFAAILRLFPATTAVGDAIMKDYRTMHNGKGAVATVEERGSIKIPIPLSISSQFSSMRTRFADTFFDVNNAMSKASPPIETQELIMYLRPPYPHLRPQLARCQNIADVLDLICDNCSLIEISLLEGLVNKLNIKKAQEVIQQYKKSVDDFCQSIRLRLCLEERFSFASPLDCEKVIFHVDKSVDESTLNDVRDLLKIACENLPVKIRVVVIREEDSYAIICSFPLALSESLIACALKNLEQLKTKGLLQLTVGYSTVYIQDEIEEISDVTNVKKSVVSSSEWATAVYTSRGTLQMLVSRSLQLANSEYQLVTMEEKHKKELTSLDEITEQLERQSKADKEMMIYQTKLKKEKESLRKDMKSQLLIKDEEMIRLQEEKELLTEQLALFISEKDTDTKHDTEDQLRKSVQEKESEIENLKVSLAALKKEVQALKEVKEQTSMVVALQKQVDDSREEQSTLKVQLTEEQNCDKTSEVKYLRKRLHGIDKVFRGTVFHCIGPEKVEVLDDAIVGVTKSGQIAFVEKGSKLEHLKRTFNFNDWQIHQLTESQFLMPGFVDTHTHAPQFHLTDLGNEKSLEEWLQDDIYPCEKKFVHLSHAKETYPQVVKRTLTNGTTTASYYATIHLEPTKELCIAIARSGQRALVGKVSMDINSPPDYIESSTEQSVSDTLDFIEFVNGMEIPLIQPVITPRYLPNCTKELLQKLSQVAKEKSLRVQSILCQQESEISHTLEVHPGHDNCPEIFDKFGLLTEKTCMAHCIHMKEEELQLLKKNNVGIAHCPKLNYKSNVMDVRDRLNRGIKVGLGTNIPAKSSPSILGVINHAMQASKMKPGSPLTLDEAFYMGTLGGAQVLNLDDEIGNFQVGKQFDALIVDVKAVGKQLATGDTLHEIHKKDILKKFIYDGDDRNIVKVFVAGQEVINKIRE